MSVSPEKQMFKCFVCGTAGGPIKFVSLIKNQPYVLALEELANKVGVDFKSKKNVKTYSEKQLRLFEINKEAMNFFQYSLSIEVGDKALEYVKSRGLSQEIIDNFSIGYAPSSGLKDFLIKKGYDEADLINLSLINSSGNDFFKDRLIFTIKDEDNNIVGFSGRDLSNKAQAKYINSSESEIFKKSTIIYNFSQVKNFLNKDKIIYINEGFMDVIAMSRAGIKNSVAIMGTSLTKEHLKTLSNFKIRLFLDSDKAGINATIKSIKILLENKISVEVVQNNTALDPDEILDKKGVEELIKISNNLISGIEFIFNMHKKQYGNTNIANVKKFVKTFKKYLILLDPIEQSFYIKKACKYLSIDEKSFSIPRNKNISSVTQQLQDNNKLLDTTKIKKPFKIDSIDDKHN
ncbi:MAG: DNA primase [Tenericutes bacterium]|nr:MAG: DNA primase [Mycoplasmatota bacterium]